MYEIVIVLDKQTTVVLVEIVLLLIVLVTFVMLIILILIVQTIGVPLRQALRIIITVMKYAVTRVLCLFCMGFSQYFCFFYKKIDNNYFEKYQKNLFLFCSRTYISMENFLRVCFLEPRCISQPNSYVEDVSNKSF